MKKVILWIVLILLLVLLGGVIWQWNNLKAVYHALTTDPETIEQELEQTRTENKRVLEETYHIRVSPPTKEQTQALIEGKVQIRDVQKELGLDTVSSDIKPTDASGIVEKYTNMLYAYQVELMGQLGSLKQQYADQWKDLPKEQRTSEKKKELEMQVLHQCYDMEAQSDAKVKGIISQCK